MPFEVVVLVLTGAAAALVYKYLNAPRKSGRRELAPVRVRVQPDVARRRRRA